MNRPDIFILHIQLVNNKTVAFHTIRIYNHLKDAYNVFYSKT